MSDDTILHQADVEEVIDDRIDVADDDYVHKGTTSIAAPTAPGATYAQAEAASTRTAVVNIINALVAAGLLIED